MIEMLIVLTVLAVLLLLWYLFSQSQLEKSRDAQRKADLDRIRIAFEDYYNDTGCYPEPGVLDACYTDSFSPYLQRIPCDPMTGEPYLYIPLQDDHCRGYRLFAGLENLNDPAIEAVGCLETPHCGVMEPFNYGISSGVPVVIPDFVPPDPEISPTPSPTSSPVVTPSPAPTPPPTQQPQFFYACDSAGTCNVYSGDNIYLDTCPVTFSDPNCSNQCSNPANWCSG